MKHFLQCERLWIGAALVVFFFSSHVPLEAQLFDGGGLFNRKTEAPRAQTEDEIGVPVPVTGRVEALKGHEVQFEIRAESKTPGATVEFLIRAFPSAGRIVSMVSKPNERNKAIVVYYADPASSATSDAFSFAVRYRGGRYSSEMRYDIDLVDLKTEVQVPPETAFGEVMIGNEEVREVTVRNLGGGSMERQIFLAPPWHLLDPADGKLNLGPRGARVLKIAFRPELMGETSYLLSFSRSKSGTTKLIGTGADPFEVVTETIQLVLDEKSGERRGEIELKNPGSKALVVEARASTRLQTGLLEGYLLAPGQITKVPVKLTPTDTAPIDGSVEFFLKNGYTKPARVIAPVVPARLVVTVPEAITSEVINFGKVEAGRSTERGLTVTNHGGVAVPLEFHVPEPFRLLTNPGPQLAPLSSVNLSVGLFPTAARRGLVDVTMNIYGNDQTVPIRLLGNVIAPVGGTSSPGSGGIAVPNLPSKGIRFGGSGTKSPGPTTVVKDTSTAPAATGFPAAAPPSAPIGKGLSVEASPGGQDWSENLDPGERAEATSPLGFVTRALVERKFDAGLRRPEDLIVLEKGSDSLVIGWTAPKGMGPSMYEVEMRGTALDAVSGEPVSVWTPYPAVTLEQIDRLVKAQIAKLNPMTQYEIRVVLTTEDGRSAPPSEALVAETDRPMDWTYIYIAIGLALLVGVALGIRKVYLDRRPEVYQTQYVDV